MCRLLKSIARPEQNTLESKFPMMDNIQSYVSLLRRLAPQAKRLTLDSRHVREGDVFVAVPGLHRDGREFLEEASKRPVHWFTKMTACAVYFRYPPLPCLP